MTGYLDRLQQAIHAGSLPAEPGAVTSVTVEHGHGCHAPSAPCVCHPRITAITGDEVLVIGSGGAILERSKRQ